MTILKFGDTTFTATDDTVPVLTITNDKSTIVCTMHPEDFKFLGKFLLRLGYREMRR